MRRHDFRIGVWPQETALVRGERTINFLPGKEPGGLAPGPAHGRQYAFFIIGRRARLYNGIPAAFRACGFLWFSLPVGAAAPVKPLVKIQPDFGPPLFAKSGLIHRSLLRLKQGNAFKNLVLNQTV
jgi:hypothetical protein